MNSTATILLVDDNPVVVLSTSEVLKTAGYTVIEATTGAECLRLARERMPDLILLDVILPDANGIDLSRAMKADPELQHLFVVLLSGSVVSSSSRSTGLEAGADGYITRPIENREFLARVQAMLRLQQAETGLRRARNELEDRVQQRTAELSTANSNLRAISLRLVEVQEIERRHLACELHDELGQVLTGAKLLLQMTTPNAPDPIKGSLHEVVQMLDDLLERVRNLALNLRPQILDDLGLVAALRSLFDRYSRQTGIHVHFKEPVATARLPSHLESTLFRTVQEALTNVARYAGVKDVNVELWSAHDRVGVEVQDWGAGFDTQKPRESAISTGLSSMRERSELLGGTFHIESSIGKGTRVRAELPLAPPGQPTHSPLRK